LYSGEYEVLDVLKWKESSKRSRTLSTPSRRSLTS
jgi:hypothetical protein